MRSMLLHGTMTLSQIDPGFEDLSYHGISSAHQSSLFITKSMSANLRLGIETLAGNAEDNERTMMNFQGMGIVLDYHVGHKWFLNAGIHSGGVIVNALSNNTPVSKNRVDQGIHYKDNGIFLAPYLGAGVKYDAYEFSFLVKQLQFSGGINNSDIKAFSSLYSGLGLAMNF